MTARKVTELEDWEKASTLGETVFRLVKDKKTNEAEFKALLQFYGRERLVKVYKQELERRRANDPIEI